MGEVDVWKARFEEALREAAAAWAADNATDWNGKQEREYREELRDEIYRQFPLESEV